LRSLLQPDRTEEFRAQWSFAKAALIILSENNMVARADHGMIGLGVSVLTRSASEHDA
jgi:hypothetical protein